MNMKSIKIQVKSSAFYKLLYLHPSVSFIISFLKLPICNSKQMDYLAHGLPLLTPPLCSSFCSLCSPPPKITTLAQSFIQQLCHTVHSRNLCGRPVIPMACFITLGNFQKQSFWSSNFPLSIKQLKNIRCCTTCAEYYNPWLNYKKLNPALQICMITELCVLQHTIFVFEAFL